MVFFNRPRDVRRRLDGRMALVGVEYGDEIGGFLSSQAQESAGLRSHRVEPLVVHQVDPIIVEIGA
ncbi:MAG: hypothetical protein AUG74_06100 [Bacteroidetes bacterium 13_1_20CM_4_60_6]|nr:MAG: hypothetical protein AUG74_06100 [Bacteroidetes bacterium 13_1_20CM_4_60_6]